MPPSQETGVKVANDGSLTLVDDGYAPPAAASAFQHFGTFVSQLLPLDAFTNRVSLRYRASTPTGSAVALDLRGSADGRRWTAWQTDLEPGALVRFDRTVRFVQYRARLFGGASALPVVAQVTVAAAAPQESPPAAEQQAPTYTLRATRMGMVGGRTANGHRIRPRDHFVSLPSWRSLCSKGGNEYMVRISYKGRSTVAPVYDVGPWNAHDNYWDSERERFGDLPRGWPEDHAAYYDKYNGGYAEKGYVRFPTGIDVGDGVWWDDLGIHGDQAEVEVTFLWLGQDPQGEPPTATASLTPEASATTGATATPHEQQGVPISGTPQPSATSEPTVAPPTATEAAPSATSEPTVAPPTATEAAPSATPEPTVAPPTTEAAPSATPEPTVAPPTTEAEPSATSEPTVAPPTATEAAPALATVAAPTATAVPTQAR